MGLGRSQTAALVGRACRVPAELAKTAFYVGMSIGRLMLFPPRHEGGAGETSRPGTGVGTSRGDG